jgi:xylulokinase
MVTRPDQQGTVALGLDMGTSFIKAAVVDAAGGLVSRASVKSPWVPAMRRSSLSFSPRQWWRAVQRVSIEVLVEAGVRRLANIALTGVSPALVVFDLREPDSAAGLPYWWLRAVDGRSVGRSRTERRLAALIAHANQLVRPAVTDLIGYIVFRLTGELTVNDITLRELGLDSAEQLSVPRCQRPRAGTPFEVAGVTQQQAGGVPNDVDVMIGCPDSAATALAVGLSQPDDLMIYLGTFGSVLRLLHPLPPYLDIRQRGVPYTWALSVPRLGPQVQAYARRWFPEASAPLADLDAEASRTPAGARGVHLRLPIWDAIGQTHGRFQFAFAGKEPCGPEVGLRARATLESLAFAVLALGPPLNPSATIPVAGGGASSRAWTQALADVLGRRLSVSPEPSGVAGAHAIASRAFGAGSSVVGRRITLEPTPGAFEAAQEARRASEVWYRRLDLAHGMEQ